MPYFQPKIWGSDMIKLAISRKPTQGNYFVSYLLTVNVDETQYDLKVDFLLWAHIQPNEATAFFLRPEADAGTYKEPRTPVEKKEVLDGMFEYRWKEGAKEIRDLINTISFPLNPKENVELFRFCFNDPVRFSQTYNDRLKELETYSHKNDQEVWSAPKWSEVDSESLVPIEKVPKETDDFFLNVMNYPAASGRGICQRKFSFLTPQAAGNKTRPEFKLRFEAAGHEIHDK